MFGWFQSNFTCSLPKWGKMEGHIPALPSAEDGARKPMLPGEIDAEEIIANRAGEVLLKHTVLKADHFPSE